MSVEHTVRIPMYVNVSKKTKTALNLNKYRNMHHVSSNNQKKQFKKEMAEQIKALPKMSKIHIHYIVNPKVKRDFDVGNVASIVDKFFSDALVELGVLPDDNYKHIPSTSQQFGEFTHGEAHVIAVITDLKPKKERAKPMRILLDDEDFREAVEDFVEAKGVSNATGVSIQVVNGKIEAEVSIGSPNPKAPPATTPTTDTPPPATTDTEQVDPEEEARLELLQEARSAKIKGIRSDMKIETLREKLQEHNDEQAGGTADVDENSGSGDNGDTTGPAVTETSSPEGTADEEVSSETEAQRPNPSEDSPEESSEGVTTTDSADTAEEEAVTPPAKKNKSSIFDVD